MTLNRDGLIGEGDNFLAWKQNWDTRFKLFECRPLLSKKHAGCFLYTYVIYKYIGIRVSNGRKGGTVIWISIDIYSYQNGSQP